MTTTSTTTDDPTLADILTDILAHPHDDTPRLVYADRLDELAEKVECGRGCRFVASAGQHCAYERNADGSWSWNFCVDCRGTGLVSDGHAERAESIRVQCRIAEAGRASVARLNDGVDWSRCTGVSAVWCPNCGDCSCADREHSMSDRGCPLHDPASNHDCIDRSVREMDALRARELELFRGMVHGGRASFGLPNSFVTTLDQINADLQTPTDHHTFPVAFVRRGFVAELRCSTAAFLGGACPGCDGRGWERYTDAAGSGDDRPCKTCATPEQQDRWQRGTGRTPGLAAAVFAGQPVVRVVLDREPADRTAINERWYWFRNGRNALGNWEDNSHLPDALFDRLKGARPDDIGLPYPTRQAALDALSRAACNYGRGLAGLGPLPSGQPGGGS